MWFPIVFISRLDEMNMVVENQAVFLNYFSQVRCSLIFMFLLRMADDFLASSVSLVR